MDRDIYRDPITGVMYDPLKVHRKLVVGSRNEINKWLADHRNSDDLVSLAAEEKLLPVIRAAFDLAPIDPTGRGITDAHALAVLERFLEYAQGKEKRGQDSPTGSPCAVCPEA
jgi:hypothetical protein